MAFLRSAGGDDPVNRLWVLEVASGAERLVADPATLLGDGAEDLPPEERARRERARERAGGIVAFAADLDLTVASFALAGRLFVAGLADPDGRPGSCRRARACSTRGSTRPAPGWPGSPAAPSTWPSSTGLAPRPPGGWWAPTTRR